MAYANNSSDPNRMPVLPQDTTSTPFHLIPTSSDVHDQFGEASHFSQNLPPQTSDSFLSLPMDLAPDPRLSYPGYRHGHSNSVDYMSESNSYHSGQARQSQYRDTTMRPQDMYSNPDYASEHEQQELRSQGDMSVTDRFDGLFIPGGTALDEPDDDGQDITQALNPAGSTMDTINEDEMLEEIGIVNGGAAEGVPPDAQEDQADNNEILCPYPDCQKRGPYRRDSKWRKHEARHKRPHECDGQNCKHAVPGQGFATVHDLSRHRKSCPLSSYQAPKELLYACDFPECISKGVTKTRKDNLMDHIRRQHMPENGFTQEERKARVENIVNATKKKDVNGVLVGVRKKRGSEAAQGESQRRPSAPGSGFGGARTPGTPLTPSTGFNTSGFLPAPSMGGSAYGYPTPNSSFNSQPLSPPPTASHSSYDTTAREAFPAFPSDSPYSVPRTMPLQQQRFARLPPPPLRTHVSEPVRSVHSPNSPTIMVSPASPPPLPRDVNSRFPPPTQGFRGMDSQMEGMDNGGQTLQHQQPGAMGPPPQRSGSGRMRSGSGRQRSHHNSLTSPPFATNYSHMPQQQILPQPQLQSEPQPQPQVQQPFEANPADPNWKVRLFNAKVLEAQQARLMTGQSPRAEGGQYKCPDCNKAMSHGNDMRYITALAFEFAEYLAQPRSRSGSLRSEGQKQQQKQL